MSGAPVLVLVIEDDAAIRRFLRAGLESQGFSLVEAENAEAGIHAAAMRSPELVLLDLGLPDADGIEVVRRLREWSAVPVLVLSARGQESDKVRVLDAGADDYVTKPFGMGELLARIRAALRRDQREVEVAIVETPDFTVDLAAKRVVRTGLAGPADGEEVRLTPIEWGLVEALVRNAGRLVGQRALLQQVWGPGYGTEGHYLRVHMAHIRRKLEPDPSRPRYFLTEPGMGYRFETSAPGEGPNAQ